MAMENHFNSKISYTLPCSIAMLNYQRVNLCYMMLHLHVYTCIRTVYVMVDQNSFARERPIFANKNRSQIFRELHAYLSRYPC